MPGSPRKRARRLAAAGLTPQVSETAPPDLRAGAREPTPSEPLPPEPTSKLPTLAAKDGPDAPAWLKEAAARAEAAERAQTEALALLPPRGKGGEVYSPAHCEAAILLGQTGMDITEIAVRFGVARQTLYAWAEREDDFARALARAHEASEAYHHALIREQLSRPGAVGNAGPYLSYMARRFPHWREKQEIEQNVTVTHDDRVARRMTLIAERRKVIDGEAREVH